MSLGAALTSSHSVHQSRFISLLPFLYYTQTILSQPPPPKSRTPLCNHSIKRRDLCSTPQNRIQACSNWRSERNVFQDDIFSHPGSTPVLDPTLPFENVQSQSQSQSKAQNSKRSTMTASEKVVFERIFKDIDQLSANKSEEQESMEDEQDMETDPYEDLNAIFDAAIQQLRDSEARGAESAMRRQQRPLQAYERAIDQLVDRKGAAVVASPKASTGPIKLANGAVLGADMELKENEGEMRKACEDHKEFISHLLERATTDVQIWTILEKEVFGLIKQLEVQLKLEEKARKAQEREGRKAVKGRKTAKHGTASDDTVTDRQSSLKLASLPATPASIALPTNTLFSILQNNYADYLLSALRLLRRHHPTSFYALFLLPTVKRLGPISYVLGASTDLYNEVLFLKWTQFSDLHGMADLMQEMVNQGIEMNEVTMVFIRRLSAKKRYGRMGRFGPIVQKWWDMRGHVEGWRRVWSIYEDVRREGRARREREALMAGKEYEGEGEVDEDD